MILESCSAKAYCVAEVDANGDPVRSYVHGPGIDNLLAITTYGAETNTYYALTDHLGTVNALADETGVIVESYEYDAWGNITVYDENDVEIPQSQYGNRFTFQGREYSWSTGLYNFRARWYDPVTGQWLSKDPIGIEGGLNQYIPFANNPMNNIDPDGLSVYRIAPDGTAGWTGRWGEVADEIEKGMAATADGVNLFGNPYESYYTDECGNMEKVYRYSRGVASLSRDVLLFAWGAGYASRASSGGRIAQMNSRITGYAGRTAGRVRKIAGRGTRFLGRGIYGSTSPRWQAARGIYTAGYQFATPPMTPDPLRLGAYSKYGWGLPAAALGHSAYELSKEIDVDWSGPVPGAHSLPNRNDVQRVDYEF